MSQIIFPSFSSSSSSCIWYRDTLAVNNLQQVSLVPSPTSPRPNMINWMCIGRNLHWHFTVISLIIQTVGPRGLSGSVTECWGGSSRCRTRHTASQNSTWSTHWDGGRSEESRRVLLKDLSLFVCAAFLSFYLHVGTVFAEWPTRARHFTTSGRFT